VPEPVGLVSIDVSFISLGLVLPVLLPFLTEDAVVVCLVKPQFEAGREKVGKHGVVREPETHLEVIEKVLAFARSSGYGAFGLDFSPVKGPQGNIEYLLALSKDPSLDRTDLSPEAVVSASHETLN
jgi:23S rRNA (cytidine1920-2'-O)/16S rRNA (cytidine1409-2'-O)-methyltransferase